MFLNQIGYWGWGSNGLICRLYSLVSPVFIQIIIIFLNSFPGNLVLLFATSLQMVVQQKMADFK